MGQMPKRLVAIDLDALADLKAEIPELCSEIRAIRLAPAPEWVPAGEYAKMAGVTRRTAMNWINAGRIESSRHGATVMVRVGQIPNAQSLESR